MWIKDNYRRNLLDMHIDDWNEEFLSKLDCDEYVDALVAAGMQSAMVKAKSHTGLCYYPTQVGRMHKGLKGWDFFGEMVEKCHAKGITIVAYFTQIFDNWAYDNHPDWRVITPDGKTYREYRGGESQFKNGRYGIVCPNNPGYRAYVRENIQELNRRYRFEGMFLDMTFWPDICFCPHCRERYLKETGREMPRTIDWDSEVFQEYAHLRSLWMADYAKFATASAKEINPEVTIEHQCSMLTSPWFHGSTELLTEAVDYCGGDYYGGFLQQTFINKFYKSVSPSLPFIYHTSRCDPELNMHTTTKTAEELTLHVITALLHNGAFQLVDAINPDGTIVPEVYHDLMKRVFAQTRPYESVVTGDLEHNAAIWFATHAKYDPAETGLDVSQKSYAPKYYMESPVKMASILRENNIPFDVIGNKNLKDTKADVLILSHVAHIRDEEMDDIEAYVNRGGSLYVSGPVGHRRLEQLIGIEITGKTGHDFTYMAPTPEGQAYFQGFSDLVPLTVTMQQYQAVVKEKDVQVLATLTLPYNMTNTDQFAAIHSNPPGIRTDEPAAVCRKTGKGGRILWIAAPVEITRPYMSRQVINRMIADLAGERCFASNAPKFVEVLRWRKDGRLFLAAVNQQEEPPVVRMYDIWIDVPEQVKKATLLADNSALEVQAAGKGSRILLPAVDLFAVMELEVQ